MPIPQLKRTVLSLRLDPVLAGRAVLEGPPPLNPENEGIEMEGVENEGSGEYRDEWPP